MDGTVQGRLSTLFETQRLIARAWTEDDAAAALEMYGDPEVTKYLGTGRVEPDVESQRETLRKAIDKYKDMDNGLGFWAVVEKETKEIVGSTLLEPLPESDKIEVGWHFKRSAWGKGYATEISREMLNYGFDTIGLSEIYAVAFPENERSLRVAKKIGMTNIGLQQYYGRMLESFVIKRG